MNECMNHLPATQFCKRHKLAPPKWDHTHDNTKRMKGKRWGILCTHLDLVAAWHVMTLCWIHSLNTTVVEHL